jgi:hypothetical protein
MNVILKIACVDPICLFYLYSILVLVLRGTFQRMPITTCLAFMRDHPAQFCVPKVLHELGRYSPLPINVCAAYWSGIRENKEMIL